MNVKILLSQINIPILSEEQFQICEGTITESELLNAVSMQDC